MRVLRTAALSALVALVACGDTKPPPDAPARNSGSVGSTQGDASATKAGSGNAGAATSTNMGAATGAVIENVKPAEVTGAQQAPAVDVAAGVEAVLIPLVRHDAGAADPVKLEAKLVDLLDKAGLGTAESRSQVASVVLKDILAKAKAAGGAGGELSPVQRAALKELARQIASDFYRRLPAGGTAHTGALVGTARSVKLPEDCTEAPWSVLGGFAYEEGKPLPEAVTKLKGVKVGMTGYMMTLEEVEDIHEFLLVESLWSCCFGKPPEVHQVVVVTIPAKKGVDMTPVPILLTGVLDVGEVVEDGFVTSVYRLKAESFKELE